MSNFDPYTEFLQRRGLMRVLLKPTEKASL